MKALKIISLVAISALFVFFAVLLQVNCALGGTVLSVGYFNSVFDKSFTAENISSLASGISGSAEAFMPLSEKDRQALDSGKASDALKNRVQATESLLKDAVDAKWLQSELPKLAKNSFTYFMTGEGSLPIVDIRPLKSALSKALAEQSPMMGLLGADSLIQKDSLDLNLLAQKAYGTKDNPVSGFGAMFSGMRSGFFLINLSVVILLLALIAVIAFRPARILRWMGVPLVISGALCLVPPVLALISNGALRLELMQALGAEGLAVVRDWLLAYLNGAALFMLIQSVVVIAIGVVLLVCARRVDRGESGAPHAVAMRAVAAIVILAAIPIAAYVFARPMAEGMLKYDKTLRMADRADRMPFSQAIDETIGSSLFEALD